MAKSRLRFDRNLQRRTIWGCQVLCSLFLLLSFSGALEVANAQTSDEMCISGETIKHLLPDGHVAVGHRITRVAEDVSGLTPGDYGNRNSNGDWHGRRVSVEVNGPIYVRYYDNGMLLSECGFDSEGKPWYSKNYSNGKREGVQYYFYDYDNGSWEFTTYRADRQHGPRGWYDEGNLANYFRNYSNGKKEGVEYAFNPDGSWYFRTYRADTQHGPYGEYNSRGQKHGYFGSYTNGNRNPGRTHYHNGERE